MSLIGEGAVAIWHDFTPEGRAEFYAWHGREHMPERVGIPGFLRGRRYVAIRGDLEFFNLYEARVPQVLASPDYRERLNNPTPWTSTVVKNYRRVARSICRVAATFGKGQGGLISTWRYDVPDDEAARHIETLKGRILPEIAASGLVAGAHLLIADTEASAVDTAERQARAEPNRIPRWVLMVEGWADEASFSALCRTALSDDVLIAAGASGPAAAGLYQLQVTIAAADLEAGVGSAATIPDAGQDR